MPREYSDAYLDWLKEEEKKPLTPQGQQQLEPLKPRAEYSPEYLKSIGREPEAKTQEKDILGEISASLGRGALGLAKLPAEIVKLASDLTGIEAAGQAVLPYIEKIEEIQRSPALAPGKAAGGPPIELDRIIASPTVVASQVATNVMNPNFWAAQVPEAALSSLPYFFGSWMGRAASTVTKAGRALKTEIAAAKAAGVAEEALSTVPKIAELAKKVARMERWGGYSMAMAQEAAAAEQNLREWEGETGKKVGWLAKNAVQLLGGAVAGSLEAMSLRRIFMGKKGMTLIRKMIDSIATEGSTEGAQEFVANAFRKVGYDPDQKLTENVVESMLVGAALGGLFGAGEISGENIKRYKEHVREMRAKADEEKRTLQEPGPVAEPWDAALPFGLTAPVVREKAIPKMKGGVALVDEFGRPIMETYAETARKTPQEKQNALQLWFSGMAPLETTAGTTEELLQPEVMAPGPEPRLFEPGPEPLAEPPVAGPEPFTEPPGPEEGPTPPVEPGPEGPPPTAPPTAPKTFLEEVEEAIEESKKPPEETALDAKAPKLPKAPPTAPEAPTPPAEGITPAPEEIAPPAEAEAAETGIVRVPTEEILADPDRFQFKMGAEERTGAGLALRDTKKWDDRLAGVITLWRDPEGKLFVVNGHQRLALAKRLDVESINAQILDSANVTDTQARALGALINIGEGGPSTKEIDIAKFLRDSEKGPEYLEESGISLSDRKVQRAVALASLSDPIFHDVVMARFPLEKAIVIGQELADNVSAQESIFETLKKKDMTNEKLRELLRLGKTAPVQEGKQVGLFGEDEIKKSLLGEQSELLAFSKNQLKKEKSVFGLVGREKGRLEEAGNILDPETNKLITKDAAEALDILDKTVYLPDSRSNELLKEYAQKLADATGEQKATVRREFYGKLKEAIPGDREYLLRGTVPGPEAGELVQGAEAEEVGGLFGETGRGAGEERVIQAPAPEVKPAPAPTPAVTPTEEAEAVTPTPEEAPKAQVIDLSKVKADLERNKEFQDLADKMQEAWRGHLKDLSENRGWTLTPEKTDWRPLELIVSKDDVGKFMFMGKSPAGDIMPFDLYLYKDSDSRRYLNLDEAGNAYKYDSAKNTYRPISHKEALSWIDEQRVDPLNSYSPTTMRRFDYANKGLPERRLERFAEHERFVREAYERGEEIAPEVLKEYDFAAKKEEGIQEISSAELSRTVLEKGAKEAEKEYVELQKRHPSSETTFDRHLVMMYAPNKKAPRKFYIFDKNLNQYRGPATTSYEEAARIAKERNAKDQTLQAEQEEARATEEAKYPKLEWGKGKANYVRRAKNLADWRTLTSPSKEVGYIQQPYERKVPVYYRDGKLIRVADWTSKGREVHEVMPEEITWRNNKLAREIKGQFLAPAPEGKGVTRKGVTPEGFVKSLRNPLKKAYAEKYLDWINKGRLEGQEPDTPQKLSYMAAQAVRMELDSILRDYQVPPIPMEATPSENLKAKEKQKQEEAKEIKAGSKILVNDRPGTVLEIVGDRAKVSFEEMEGPGYMYVPVSMLKQREKIDSNLLSKIQDSISEEKLEIGANKYILAKQLGESAYASDLADITVKEMVQNSFDAIKSALEQGKKSGNIEVIIDYDKRTITVIDDGVGMNKTILKEAFFVIGGTYKEDLPIEKRSGGYGFAKMSTFLNADRVEVETYRDGIMTKGFATKDAIVASLSDVPRYKGKEKDDFVFKEYKVDKKKHGTKITLYLPEYRFNEKKDANEPIYMPNRISSIEPLKHPLVGPVNIDVTVKAYLKEEKETLSLGNHFDFSKIPHQGKVFFNWGFADVYFGDEYKHRDDWGDTTARHSVLSAGVYQLRKFFQIPFTGESIPYDIIVDIQPTVKPDHRDYPFTLNREALKERLKEDWEKLAGYLGKIASGREAEGLKENFKDVVSLPRTDVDEGEVDPAEWLRKQARALEAVKEKYEKEPPPKYVPPKEVEVDDQGVKDRKTGEYVWDKKKAKENVAKGSFRAEKPPPDLEKYLLETGYDTNKPVLHNNTNIDLDKYPNAPLFFAELGSVFLEMKERASDSGLANAYKKLKGMYFVGVSIDKKYAGVHLRVPYKAIMINPFGYNIQNRNIFGDSELQYMTMVHELAHTVPTFMAHGEEHNANMERLLGYFADVGLANYFRDKITKVMLKHENLYKEMKNEFKRSATRNIAKSLKEFEDKGKKSRIGEFGEVKGAIQGEAGALPTGRLGVGREPLSTPSRIGREGGEPEGAGAGGGKVRGADNNPKNPNLPVGTKIRYQETLPGMQGARVARAISGTITAEITEAKWDSNWNHWKYSWRVIETEPKGFGYKPGHEFKNRIDTQRISIAGGGEVGLELTAPKKRTARIDRLFATVQKAYPDIDEAQAKLILRAWPQATPEEVHRLIGDPKLASEIMRKNLSALERRQLFKKYKEKQQSLFGDEPMPGRLFRIKGDATRAKNEAKITTELIKQRVGGVEVIEYDEAWFVILPTGKQIGIFFDEIPVGSFEDLKKTHTWLTRKDYEKARVAGEWRPMNYGGAIALAKEAGAVTLDHELFHAACSLVLTPKEMTDILLEHGDWESAAIAYEKWNPAAQPKTVFQKILSFFSKLAKLLKPNRSEGVFENIRNGSVWLRTDTGRETTRGYAQQVKTKAPIFFSQLERVAEDILPESAKAGRMADLLENQSKKGQFKKDEMKWSGIIPWLRTKQGVVTKKELMDFLRGNRIRVKETTIGFDERETPVKALILFTDEQLRKGLEASDLAAEEGFDWSDANRDQMLEILEDEIASGGDEAEALIYEAAGEPWSKRKRYEGPKVKYSGYTLPGGTNYREVMLSWPLLAKEQEGFSQWARNVGFSQNQIDAELENPAELYFEYIEKQRPLQMALGQETPPKTFRSPHYPEIPNVFAHIRFNDRMGPYGEKILFIETLQGDWARIGEKEGFQPEKSEIYWKGDEIGYYGVKVDGKDSGYLFATTHEARAYAEHLKPRGIPRFPFAKNWHEVAMKWAIRHAAENGYDAIAWTTGEQQTKRWPSGEKYVKQFYDKSLINFVRKYGAQWGTGPARIEIDTIPPYVGTKIYGVFDELNQLVKSFELQGAAAAFSTQDEGYRVRRLEGTYETVHSLPISQSMRQSALYEGQRMFRLEVDEELQNIRNENIAVPDKTPKSLKEKWQQGKATLKEKAKTFYQHMIYEHAPWEWWEKKKIDEGIKVSHGESIKHNLDYFRAFRMRADMAVMGEGPAAGVFQDPMMYDEELEQEVFAEAPPIKVGESLEVRLRTFKELAKSKGISAEQAEADLFDSYMWAQRMEDLSVRRPDLKGLKPEQAARTMALLKEKYGEDIQVLEDAAREVRGWLRQVVLDPLLQVGRLSQDAYDRILKESHESYLPYFRLSEDIDNQMTSYLLAEGIPNSVIKEMRTGSEKKILHPLQTIIDMAYKTQYLYAKNRIMRSFYGYGVKGNDPEVGIVKAKYLPAPFTMKQQVDAVLRPQLIKLANDLNVDVKVVAKMRKGKMGAFKKALQDEVNFGGLSQEEADEIQVRFATFETTLAHELGHAIDDRYGLVDRLIKNVPEAVRKEFRAIADQRLGDSSSKSHKKYVRKRTEQVAEFISRYIIDRRTVENLAPNALRYFEEIVRANPKLHPILGFKLSHQRGMLLEMEMKAWARDPRPPEPNVFPFWQDGKFMWLKLPEDLARVSRNHTPAEIDVFTRVAKGFADVMKAGAVLPFEFSVGKNWARDLVQIWAFSSYGFNPLKIGKTVKGLLTKDPKTMQYQGEFLAGAGGMATLAESAYNAGYITHDKVMSDPKKIDYVKSPIHFLVKTAAFVENLSRLTNYIEARKAGLSHQEAIHEARDASLDFRKSGGHPVVRYLNNVIPFFRASLLGIDKISRELTGANRHKVIRRLAGLTTFSLLLWALVHNDDRYKELEDWQKNYFWHLPLGKDGPILRMPKPFEAGILFGSIPERMAEYLMSGGEAKDIKGAMMAAFDVTVPDLMPAMVRPVWEARANWNFFMHRPIEDASLQKLPPELRAKPWTSELAKAIGKYTGPTLDISPVKVENFVRGWGAGLGYNYIFLGADVLLRKTGVLEDIPQPAQDKIQEVWGVRAFFTKRPTGYRAKSVNDFFEHYQEITMADQGWKTLWKQKQMDKVDKFLAERPEAMFARVARKYITTLGDIKQERTSIQLSKKLTSNEKKEKLDVLDQKIVRIARQANQFMNPEIAQMVGLPPRRNLSQEDYYNKIAAPTAEVWKYALKHPALLEDKERLVRMIKRGIATWKPKAKKKDFFGIELEVPTKLEIFKFPPL